MRRLLKLLTLLGTLSISLGIAKAQLYSFTPEHFPTRLVFLPTGDHSTVKIKIPSGVMVDSLWSTKGEAKLDVAADGLVSVAEYIVESKRKGLKPRWIRYSITRTCCTFEMRVLQWEEGESDATAHSMFIFDKEGQLSSMYHRWFEGGVIEKRWISCGVVWSLGDSLPTSCDCSKAKETAERVMELARESQSGDASLAGYAFVLVRGGGNRGKAAKSETVLLELEKGSKAVKLKYKDGLLVRYGRKRVRYRSRG